MLSANSSFQSPFHRGNGCYWFSAKNMGRRRCTFSPLFIGAMVATSRSFPYHMRITSSFSPLFIGAMVATECFVIREAAIDFQSPFHRGNGCYSIPMPEMNIRASSFSPLFIGAMVATVKQILISRTWITFSPLFIGAMVATINEGTTGTIDVRFQSPFHRGNGCYDLGRALVVEP